MLNRRKLIRSHVAEKLSKNPLFTGKVFNGRKYPISLEELPLITIYGKEETSEIATQAPRMLRNTFQLTIEVIVSGDEGIDDLIDDWTDTIQDDLSMDESLGNLVDRMALIHTEIASSIEGEVIVARAKMSYEIRYFTQITPASDLPVEGKIFLRPDSFRIGLSGARKNGGI